MINFFCDILMYPLVFWSSVESPCCFFSNNCFSLNNFSLPRKKTGYMLSFPVFCSFWVWFIAFFKQTVVRQILVLPVRIWFVIDYHILCSFLGCFVFVFFNEKEKREYEKKNTNKFEKKEYKLFKQPWFFTVCYLVFILIIPLFSLLNTASQTLFENFWEKATNPVALSAYTVAISMAFIASTFNAFFGFILAWVLIRYNFPGKRLFDAAVDLPFALPTSVAGLTLSTVYNDQGWIGSFLTNLGIQIVFTKLGTLLAMIFVSFPFVVRTLQPVLQEMEIELEEASWSLGGSPWKTFQKVIFPPLIPAILTGFTLAFSRAIGEYGSVVIVSSNIPLEDLIASVLIFQNLEQYDYTGATAIGTVILILSLFLLIGINFLQNWHQKSFKV